MSEQRIEIGQKWRRKSDGTVVEIVGANHYCDDYRYRKQGSSRRSPIYGDYLRARYELEPTTKES